MTKPSSSSRSATKFPTTMRLASSGAYDRSVTGRKPPGTDWESWVDQVIRDGRERGEFDDLPGTGKPIAGLDQPHDDLWWVRRKLQSEGVSYLPPALALRKDREDTLARLDTERSEPRVRQLLEELNDRSRNVNSRSIVGPPSNVMPLDVELLVQEWRERRAARVRDQAPPQASPPPTPAAGRRRWLRRKGGPSGESG